MTQDEVVALLKVISHYDKRPASTEELDAWSMSAHLAGWTLAEAAAAVHEHFAFSTEYLKQAHVTKLVQARRAANQVGSAPPYQALPPAEPASASTRAAAREYFTRHPEHRGACAMPQPGSADTRRTAPDAHRRVAQYWTDLARRRGDREAS
jgi:hypothetical protein